jgi:hypothetical protein
MQEKISLSTALIPPEFTSLLQAIPLPDIYRNEIEAILFSVNRIKDYDHARLDEVVMIGIQWVLESKMREWHMKAMQQGYLTIVGEQGEHPMWAMRLENNEILQQLTPEQRLELSLQFDTVVDYVMEQIEKRWGLTTTHPITGVGI